jgi:hypothetical protein
MDSNQKSIGPKYRYDGDAQSGISPKTDLATRHTKNARVSGSEHLDACSTSQTEFL